MNSGFNADLKYEEQPDVDELIRNASDYSSGCVWPKPAAQVVDCREAATDPKRTFAVGQI